MWRSKYGITPFSSRKSCPNTRENKRNTNSRFDSQKNLSILTTVSEEELPKAVRSNQGMGRCSKRMSITADQAKPAELITARSICLKAQKVLACVWKNGNRIHRQVAENCQDPQAGPEN